MGESDQVRGTQNSLYQVGDFCNCFNTYIFKINEKSIS